MFKVYVDESEVSHPPIFAMGGYISTAERWAKFSLEWEAALRMSPRIEYFRMNDCMNLNGQFLHWSETMRNEKLMLLQRIIWDHTISAFQIAFNPNDLKEVYGDWKETGFYEKYRYAFDQIVYFLAHNANASGVNEKIDFIFDEQVMDQEKIFAAWKEQKNKDNKRIGVSRLIGNSPSFANDREVLPLQAADHMAFVGRETLRRHFLGEPQLVLPKLPSDVPQTMPLLAGLITKDLMIEQRRLFEDFIRGKLQRRHLRDTAHRIFIPGSKTPNFWRCIWSVKSFAQNP